MSSSRLSRRDFIQVSLLAGGGLVIQACTGTRGETTTTRADTSTSIIAPRGTDTTPTTADPDAVFAHSVRLSIDGTGTVTVTGHRVEMGQGILTAMAMIVADELDADWSSVTVRQADADRSFGSQVTGGSTSIQETFRLLRTAGAEARQRLVAAAAARWGVDAAACTAHQGTVRHPDGESKFTFAELVGDAATVDPAVLPSPVLKDVGDFRIIGTPQPLAHAASVVTGDAMFASDVTIPGMRVATIAYPPSLGGRVATYDAGPALAVDGVDQVVEISSGVAVVAVDTWSAIQGRHALEVTWEPGRDTDVNSAAVTDRFRREAEAETVYDHPYYAHMSLEPMCCVVQIDGDTCTAWAPVQRPQESRQMIANAVGLPVESVTVHLPLSGGRFGRGLHPDYVEHAAAVAHAAGVPVKLVWTREDDVRRDYFHPLAAVTATSEATDPLGSISLSRRRAAGIGVPTGNWRAVGEFTDAFAEQCFFDEVAHSMGADPVDARLALLDERAANVVRLAAREADWGTPLPPEHGRGIAYFSTWGSTEVAQVAEISVEAGQIRVHRVVCAVDCGIVVNPDTVRAQMEGGIVWALTAALKNGVDIADGRVVPDNFDGLPILRFNEMPMIEVHIVESSANPSGIGEMGVSPTAPAVANAVFAATGRRLRSLPLRLEG